MKHYVLKALFVLLLGIMPYLSYADVPGTITFQAHLSDASGNQVEGATDITFFIPGTDWTEQHYGVLVNKGVFSVLLGNQMSLANVDFSQVLQLHIEVNGISQTIPISSVPYAFHANTVEHDTLNSLSCTSGQVAEWNGSSWACADKAGGVEGSQGPKGEKGDQGEKGDTGSKGEKGDQGEKGDTGAKGEKGDKGEPGSQGVAGSTGSQGPKGEKGDTGPQGVAGSTGQQGLKGEKGNTGPQGVAGSTGSQGPKGEKGDQGPQGVAGSTGSQGPKGEKGNKGEQGSQGEKGSPGDFSHCRICIYYADINGRSDLRRMMCTRMIDGHHSGRMNLLGTVGDDDLLEIKFRCDGGDSGVWNDWDH
ncbi:hypothetical protein QUF54_03650 [Candidatus Marithioploca araucensis]|uniref:Collagen triple helix repeat-containing protein n=1 Tax=Candidatus Marithioploca araucensis TaxID=70273 RepID=A0ABT7VSB9_9GAMM|nr:hypothetical protein [Candidatus Marithioploca araucensis]